MNTILKRREAHAKLMSDPFTISIHGCGGTGTAVLQGVVKISRALQKLGHKGINIKLCDPDTVSESNVIRQGFSPVDVGQNKALILERRYNQFYGDVDISSMGIDIPGAIAISCVDSKKARKSLLDNYETTFGQVYFYDCGNANRTGQVMVSPLSVLDVDRLTTGRESNKPSCSASESLATQDLFVNQMAATLVCSHLWNFLRHGEYRTWNDLYFDLKSMSVVTRIK